MVLVLETIPFRLTVWSCGTRGKGDCLHGWRIVSLGMGATRPCWTVIYFISTIAGRSEIQTRWIGAASGTEFYSAAVVGGSAQRLDAPQRIIYGIE